MLPIALVVLRICTLRSGPDDLPANNFLLGLVIAINVTLSISLYVTVNEATFLTATTLVIVSLAGTAGVVWVILTLMELANRFPQTLMALIGVDIVLTVLSGIAAAFTTGSEGTVSTTGASIITLLMIWNLAIFANIFKRAMNIHIGFGFAMALFVVIFSVAVSQAAIS